MMRYVFFLLTSLLSTNLVAQHTLEIGGLAGVCGYLGDLNKSDFFAKEPHLAFGALARYNISPRVAIRAAFLHGKGTGRDSYYADRAFRNFSTESPITEISAQIEYHFFKLETPKIERRFRPEFSPFVFAGLGVVRTDPTVDFDHMIIAKVEYLEGRELDMAAKYSHINPSVPFGVGLKYRANLNLTITVEAGFRLTFSDYLDGISWAGNPNKTDRYKFSGFTATYRFNRLITKCFHNFD
jgi:Domain of unknown function (DUF6089)